VRLRAQEALERGELQIRQGGIGHDASVAI
jgi:hypothetical protein